MGVNGRRIGYDVAGGGGAHGRPNTRPQTPKRNHDSGVRGTKLVAGVRKESGREEGGGDVESAGNKKRILGRWGASGVGTMLRIRCNAPPIVSHGFTQHTAVSTNDSLPRGH